MDYLRAMEILNPEHREQYDNIETVNEACRIGMAAIKKQMPEKVILRALKDEISCENNRRSWAQDSWSLDVVCPECGDWLLAYGLQLYEEPDLQKMREVYEDEYGPDYEGANYCPECGQRLEWRWICDGF